MRTKGKGKIRTSSHENICLNELHTATGVGVCVSSDMHTHGDVVSADPGHQQVSRVVPRPRTKLDDTSFDAQRDFANTLASGSGGHRFINAADIGTVLSPTDELPRYGGPVVPVAGFSEVPNACRGPFLLDFVTGVASSHTPNALTGLAGAVNNNGKRSLNAFLQNAGTPVLDLSRLGTSDRQHFVPHAKSASVATSSSRKRPFNDSSQSVAHEGGPLKNRRLQNSASHSVSNPSHLQVNVAPLPVTLPGTSSVELTHDSHVNLADSRMPTACHEPMQPHASSSSEASQQPLPIQHPRLEPGTLQPNADERPPHTMRSGPSMEYRAFGPCNCVCHHCHAKFWYEERLAASTRGTGPLYHHYCHGGKVQLFTPHDYPDFIRELFLDPHFLRHIRAYNQMFAMTSLGANIDETVNNGRGPYVFKVSGQVYHCIGKLCPDERVRPRFLQLYIYDTDNEVRNRLENFTSNDQNPLRSDIVEGLIHLLDHHNALV
ncbi:hypothetical protein CTI12_AA407850 [Artemisia annua]|uniref:Helitron helicase-like domain-containing protein n=1 Tax=Artemisia annua TaxID=35608 RepID=A0A2U1L3R9_ARTAN|nr:hypothetical protein CTI12_AA407850 [Artemisia annua]